ncbi:hypothetical protein FJY90_01635 [Candidatus Gottesmanbacteria bacterium]|nr:hypothetical protein [Candidatus Gottesmanbacteria bacterium]
MNRHLHFHLSHYLLLVLLLSFGVATIFNFAGNQEKQFLAAVITSLIYFLWGIIHHRLEGDLHPKVVVEYLLIALLAVLLLRGAIYR